MLCPLIFGERKMGNPKQVLLSPQDRYTSSGMAVDYVKSRRTLRFFGWYDTFVGIQGESFTLAEFFKQTGISERDCKAAFEQLKQEE